MIIRILDKFSSGLNNICGVNYSEWIDSEFRKNSLDD